MGLLGSDTPAKPYRLTVEGKAFEDFVRGTVKLTMSEPANSFDLEYMADGKTPGARAIFAGDACELAMDAGNGPETLIDGYVDTTDDDDNDDEIFLKATGRSKACDLIDCAAVAKPGSWTNAKIDKIAADLVAPFGIAVFVEGPSGDPFQSFSVQKGESPFEALSRAAAKRGLFIYSVGGDLILARAGSTRTKTVLERGKNVRRSGRTDSWYSRHSEYIFRGQARSTDENFGANASQLKSSVKDDAINRYRPTLVLASAGDGLDLKTRAELERNIRAGSGEQIRCLVDGWATDEGKIWRPNTLVRFKNPVLGVDATLLVVTATFRVGPEEPRETWLELWRPEAFDVAKYPAIGRGEKWT